MEWLKETKRNKKKLLIAVLTLTVVTLILGLGLGLGLDLQKCRNKVVPLTSCRGRCFEPFDHELIGCRCDSYCNVTNSCCHDYVDICTAALQQWECSQLRCGETRLPQSRCHCSDDCLSAGDCCTNYRHVCHGESQWVDDQCEDLSAPVCPPGFSKPTMLLVSLDGLRAEYLQTWSALVPVLHKLQTCGTSASFMQAAFPSKTFPNHYSIVTGLYPESNGLIDNIMYDPDLNATFTLSSSEKDNPAWYLGQPIWNTARDQGLKSGTFFWPGSDVKINGSFPHIYRPYDGKVPFEERVFTILKWLQLPQEERPDFYTLYLEEPDKSGHSFGPVSGGLLLSLQGVDAILRQLMNGLKQLGLHRCLNLVVVADHGMEQISCSRTEALQDLIGDTSAYVVIEGPFGRIRAHNNAVMDSAGLVSNMTCKTVDQKIKAYLKANLPKRLHFANSRRIEDVNVLVEPRWLFERSPGSLSFCSGGNHGYDNDAESMHALFLSYGPAFKSRTQIQPFSNIELYNLMCDVLQISPSNNNGTRGSLNHALRQPHFLPVFPLEESVPGACPLLSLDPSASLGCSCSALSGNAINARLNLTADEVLASENLHLPFGRPRVLQRDVQLCVLHHQGFISAFSHSSTIPLWSSFSINRTTSSEVLPPVLDECVRADVRVPHTHTCDDYTAAAAAGDTVAAFLYPPSLNSTVEQQFDALLMSNVVPMFKEFKKIWDYLHHTLLLKYANVYNGVNVLTGPVFDHDYDGKVDPAPQIQEVVPGTNISVPSHYFMVLTSCSDSMKPLTDCDGELQTVSFLLPHTHSNSESCRSSEHESLWVEDLLWFHQARVKDVEWITGLDLYQDSNRPIQELLRLKTRPTAAIHRKQ